MDESTPPRPSPHPAWRRWPSPLVIAFCALVLGNLLLIHLAFDVRSSAGGDPAGNGMSNAFVALFKDAALCIVGVPAILFAVIRKRGFRLAMAVVLGFNAVVLLALAAASQG